ncbi:(2Fe-2S)-binding protein [Kineococcus sp. SYSU DK005]|uniref:(2Fe-2S)-binding protein n=1 Tax=Kineococcus sp. SYSU DK005 TaxID=3383126 RepID=UPI003D7E3FF9
MRVRLSVNGEEREVDVEPRRHLGDVLREDLGLTGTHLACEQGVCGSCTVALDGRAVRSCLVLAVSCEGREVRTVEGLADGAGAAGLSPLQRAFSAEHALQCGFCTPGFLVLAQAALEQDPSVVDDPERLRRLLTSNLCRCTGYEPIRRAVLRAAGRDPDAPEQPR